MVVRPSFLCHVLPPCEPHAVGWRPENPWQPPTDVVVECPIAPRALLPLQVVGLMPGRNTGFLMYKNQNHSTQNHEFSSLNSNFPLTTFQKKGIIAYSLLSKYFCYLILYSLVYHNQDINISNIKKQLFKKNHKNNRYFFWIKKENYQYLFSK
jgi:hypothetical protein